MMKIEQTIRNRGCGICKRTIPPNTEIIKIAETSYHGRCLLKTRVLVAGEEKYNQLLTEIIADKV